ncbi:Interactor of constitutive active ROPs 2, chloroplastic-like protein [Drosera capensis]
MQPTKPRNISLDVPRKKSPTTPRTARQLKPPGSDSDSASSPNLSGRMSKSRSPKLIERGSPSNTPTEKRRTGKISELESQLALLQDELKKVKEHLIATDTEKKQAQQEAEETKQQFTAISTKLEESEKQLLELSASEEARVQELCRISHDRDREWQSELEAIHRQHSLDSNALASAMSEIQKLKKQLADSELKQSRHAESAYAEIQSLRVELSETLVLLEKMKHQLNDQKESEACALKVASEAEQQLKEIKATAETLRSDGLKAKEAYDSLAVELGKSNAEFNSLEMLVSKLRADISKKSTGPSGDGDNDHSKNQESEKLRAEIEFLRNEVGNLKSALEESDMRCQREYMRSTLDIGDAYAAVERAKTESALREAQLKGELRDAISTIGELKSELTSAMNKSKNGPIESEFELEHRQLESDLENLKASLLNKETQLQSIIKENEILKTKIKEGLSERSKTSDEAAAASAKLAEQEALMKLQYVAEEADKSSRRAARISEQLDAAERGNSELESELRRLKVQSDQWRKAAEAAASMLSPERNGKYVDRSVSLDSNYHAIGSKMGSPSSDEMDDDSPKKKNGNVLKKIGVFLKKGQKEKHHI